MISLATGASDRAVEGMTMHRPRTFVSRRPKSRRTTLVAAASAAALVASAAGCADSHGFAAGLEAPRSPAWLTNVSEPEIRSALAPRLRLEPPVRVILVEGPDRSLLTWRDADAGRIDATVQRLVDAELVKEVVVASERATPSPRETEVAPSGPLEPERLTAARRGGDVAVALTLTTRNDRWMNPLGVLYVSIVRLWLAPGLQHDVEARAEAVRGQAARGIPLSTVGCGAGCYDDARMERLAQLGHGTYSYVDGEREAFRLAELALAGSLTVAAKDVRLSLELDPVAVSRYRLIGYENRRLDGRDLASERAAGAAISAGQAVTALCEAELSGAVPGPIGTFRVRFQDSRGGGRIAAKRIGSSEVRASFDRASAPMRLAVTVAAFAEKLRGSYWARAVRYEELVARIEEVATALGDPASVIELRRAMVLARALDRRDDRFDRDAPAATMEFHEVPILR